MVLQLAFSIMQPRSSTCRVGPSKKLSMCSLNSTEATEPASKTKNQKTKNKRSDDLISSGSRTSGGVRNLTIVWLVALISCLSVCAAIDVGVDNRGFLDVTSGSYEDLTLPKAYVFSDYTATGIYHTFPGPSFLQHVVNCYNKLNHTSCTEACEDTTRVCDSEDELVTDPCDLDGFCYGTEAYMVKFDVANTETEGPCECITSIMQEVTEPQIFGNPRCLAFKTLEDDADREHWEDTPCLVRWECRENPEIYDLDGSVQIIDDPLTYAQFIAIGARTQYCKEHCEVPNLDDYTISSDGSDLTVTGNNPGCFGLNVENEMHWTGFAGTYANGQDENPQCYCVPYMQLHKHGGHGEEVVHQQEAVDADSDTGEYVCKQAGVPNEACYRSCINGAGGMTCDGDTIYCTTHTCVSGGTCYCTPITRRNRQMIMTPNGFKPSGNHTRAYQLGQVQYLSLYCPANGEGNTVSPVTQQELSEASPSPVPSSSISATPSRTPSQTPTISVSNSATPTDPARRRAVRDEGSEVDEEKGEQWFGGWGGRKLLSFEEPKKKVQARKIKVHKRAVEDCAETDDCTESLTLLIDCGVKFFAKLDDHELVINTVPITSGMLALKKKGYFTSLTIGGKYRTKLPDSLFTTTGNLAVTYLVNGSCYEERNLQILAESVCKFRDCLFCTDTLHNWMCLTWSQKTVLIIICVVFAAVIIAFLPIVIWILYWLVMVLWFSTKTPLSLAYMFGTSDFIKDSWGLVKKVWSWKRYFFRTDQAGAQAQQAVPQQGRNALRMTGKNLGWMVLLGFLAVAMACDSSAFVETTIENCVQTTPTTQTCDMTLETELTLETKGSVACLVLTINGTAVAQVNLTYAQSIDTLSSTLQYCTSNWTGNYDSVNHCHGSTGCPEHCHTVETKPNDHLGNDLVNDYPGPVYCKRDTPENCPIPEDSCTWYGYGVVPSGTVYDVASFGARTTTPQLNISIAGLGLDGVTSDYYRGAAVDLSGLSFQIVGSLVNPVDPNFGSMSLVWIDNNNAWVGVASAVNSPQTLNVGDIQGGHDSSGTCLLTQTGPTAFIISPELGTEVDGDKSVKYTFNSPGINTLSSFAFLPSVLFGDVWYMDGLTELVTSNRQNPGSLIVSMSTTLPVSVTVDISLVCPVAKFLNASGCVDCNQGVAIYIQANSDCVGGFASVQTNSTSLTLLTQAVQLDVESTTYVIYAQTTQAFNEDDFFLVGNGGVATFSVEFRAVFVDPVNNVSNQTIGNHTHHQGSSVGGWFQSAGKDVKHFFERLGIDPWTTAWKKWLLIGCIIAGSLIIAWFAWPFATPIILGMLSTVMSLLKPILCKLPLVKNFLPKEKML